MRMHPEDARVARRIAQVRARAAGVEELDEDPEGMRHLTAEIDLRVKVLQSAAATLRKGMAERAAAIRERALGRVRDAYLKMRTVQPRVEHAGFMLLAQEIEDRIDDLIGDDAQKLKAK